MAKENTTELDKKVQKLFDQLPEPYQEEVKKMKTDKIVEEIAEEHNLNDSGLVELDREVTYLLLRVQTSAQFMLRLEKKLGLSESEIVDITKSVTKKIIRPLEKRLNDGSSQNAEDPAVPKPPSASDKPPTPNYGGGSDPYREPTE